MSFEIARLREALETASRTGSAMGLTQSSKKCIENIVETSRLAVDIKKRHLSPGSTSGRAELMEDYKAFKSRIATMEAGAPRHGGHGAKHAQKSQGIP